MNKVFYSLYIGGMVAITIVVTAYLAWTGYDYYSTPLEERFYHPNYGWFQPGGIFGHGLGIAGTLMIFTGVALYIAAKRYNFLTRQIRLKHILEFHIFLCILGPILILFHTTFKFGGLVAIAFWSMVAVVLSGVIGRFIYIMIPRSVEGRELSLNEIKRIKNELFSSLKNEHKLDEAALQTISGATAGWEKRNNKFSFFTNYFNKQKTVGFMNRKLKMQNYPAARRKNIIKTVREEMTVSNKIVQLANMQRLFKYWHVFHMPFAIIMLIIVIIHVGIALVFGYKWIF